ncbi:MAG: hypothetical protein HGA54_04025 [Actinobacteria bacterium]|nr:hypothetical protein [Actinomycetota bacterium]
MTVSVSDGTATGSDTLLVTVSADNVAPIAGSITPNPSTSVNVGTTLSISVPFTDANQADTHTATVVWGDGTQSEMTVSEVSGTAVASHVYSVKGRYTVSVTLMDQGGLSDTATLGIQVKPATAVNQAPVAVLSGPYAAMVNTDLTVDGSTSNDPNNDRPLTFEWDTDYDSTTFSPDFFGEELSMVTVNYDTPGTYTVAMRVTDPLGMSSSIVTTTVTVSVDPPNVAPMIGPFLGPFVRTQEGMAVTISIPYTDANPDDIHTATIDWGDGTLTEAATILDGMVSGTHTYSTKGKYMVTVLVSDGDLSGSATGKVQVVPAPQNAPTTLETQQSESAPVESQLVPEEPEPAIEPEIPGVIDTEESDLE